MKFEGKVVQKVTLLAAILGTFLIGGCATLDQNMAASLKEYVVPGKDMHVADMNNYPFCEIGLITGTAGAIVGKALVWPLTRSNRGA